MGTRHARATRRRSPTAEPAAPPDLRELTPADLFDLWLLAAADSSLALAAWRGAGTGERDDAFAAYRAAAEREAAAAETLAWAAARR